MSKKLLPLAALTVAALLTSQLPLALPARAGTCASNCGPKPLQFQPGQRISLEVTNRTANLIEFQKVYGTDPVPLSPGQTLRMRQGDGTEPNISVMFWDSTGLALKANLSRPSDNLLRIELVSEYNPPGHSTVYVENDGRVIAY